MSFNPNHAQRTRALDDLSPRSSGCSEKLTLANSSNSTKAPTCKPGTTSLTRPKRSVRTLKRSEWNFDARNRARLLTSSKNWLRTMIYRVGFPTQSCLIARFGKLAVEMYSMRVVEMATFHGRVPIWRARPCGELR